MDYFSVFDLTPTFLLDTDLLRKRFYANSKRLHPDFFTQESEAKQHEILQLSSLNNEAYEALADFDKRMQYLLQMRGVLQSEGNNELPKAFLMDMMELNEALMELEFDANPTLLAEVAAQVNVLEQNLLAEVQPLLEAYDHQHTPTESLLLVKDFFLKKRYLLRIKEKLSIFANR